MKKAPVTYSDLKGLDQVIESFQKSHLDSSLNFKPCLITNFIENSNVANVILDNGSELLGMPLITPMKLVLMLLGPTTEIKNVPGIIFYNYVPEDGFVLVGDLNAFQYSDEELKYNKPFYF